MRTRSQTLGRGARHRGIPAALIAAVALLSSVAAADASPWERGDVVGQGPAGPTVAVDGASILRAENGLNVKVSMPIPEPGSYEYPASEMSPTSSGGPGHPEAFSLWAFIFFNPEACDGECDGADLFFNSDVVAGAFNVGGHLAAGPSLTISGNVNHQTREFSGPPMGESLGDALDMGFDLADAEIHLAVAPHGGLDSQLLPAQISTPAGSPSLWWLAVFK